MKRKRIALIGMIAIFSASLIHAAPTVSVQSMGTNPSGNRVWSVTIGPDASLFSNPADSPDRGTGGSLAAELAFSVSGTTLVGATVESSVWIHANPGRNPFTGSTSNGLIVNGSSAAAISLLAATSPAPSNGGSGGVVPGLPGDYNSDALVTAPDYPIFEDTLGSTTDLRADGNGNGVIDPGDYDIWSTHYGNVAALLAASSSSTNTIFAAFGSNFLTSFGPVGFLQIETFGVGPTTIKWGNAAGAPFPGGNILAQAGQNSANQNGTASVPEPPSFALALVMGLGGVTLIRCRRLASFDRHGYLVLWSNVVRQLS